MDSSDSEDDCYGNIAQKLQRMKNKYTEDRIESTNLLNDSAEIDEIVKQAGKTTAENSKSSLTRKKSNESSDHDDADSLSLESILAMSSKRVTRCVAKRAGTEVSIPDNSAPKRSNKRQKKSEPSVPETSGTNSDSNTDAVTSNSTENQQNNSQTRGRGRGRGRGRRGRTSRQSVINNFWNIPTYSVGNTDEYPDQSDSQQLFGNKKSNKEVIIVEDNEALDENEELSVKVYWQSSEFFKFTIRKFQKLKQIFDYFSTKENVSNDKLLFTFNDRILKPDDSPDSIGYSIAKFIDGGIVNQNVSELVKNNKEDQNGIKLKFQCQNVKKPFETMISFDETLSVAMMKCAEHFETSIDKLKFHFDGDLISGNIFILFE